MYAKEGIRIAAYVFFPALLIGGLREKLKRGASFFHLYCDWDHDALADRGIFGQAEPPPVQYVQQLLYRPDVSL